MKRPSPLFLVLTLWPVILIGCDEPQAISATGWDGVMRDSAGITVVENYGPTWEEGEEWRVSPEPLISVGGAEAPEQYLFANVTGAFLLGNGRIVVADMWSHQVRWFDSQGGFVQAVGREGGGPDDFGRITDMWRTADDSLVVLDLGNARIKVLGPEGKLARLIRYPYVMSILQGLFVDGSFLLEKWEEEEAAIPEGLHRSPVTYIRWKPAGELTDTLVERPGAIRYYELVNNQFLSATPPYTSWYAVATAKDRWYYSSQDRYEIEEYSPEGELLRLIRLNVPRQPVTPELVEEYREYANEYFARVPTWSLRWRLSLPMPEYLPPHGDFVVDDEGNLWVAEYSVREEPTVWSVFDSEGRLLGSVHIPPRGTLTQIGADFVLGVWKDELDVEEVRLYELIKGE
jgi:sugar lactone lactonase YvrE